MNKEQLRLLISVVIMILILLVYQKYMMKYSNTEVIENTDTTDTTVSVEDSANVVSESDSIKISVKDTLISEEKLFSLDNGKRIFLFSTKGGGVEEIILKDYKYTGSDSSVVIKNDTISSITDAVLNGSVRIDLDTINYSVVYMPKDSIITQKDSVVFSVPIGSSDIFKVFYIYPDSFNVHVVYRGHFDGKWIIKWNNGLLPTEKNIKDDIKSFMLFVGASNGKSLYKYSYKSLKKGEKSLDGIIDFIGVSSKYFVSALLPYEPDKVSGFTAYMYDKDDPVSFSYELVYQQGVMPSFIWYTGPSDYDILQSVRSGFGNIVNFGWKYFAPIGKLILKILKFLHKFIPNYGFVIVIFTILLFFLFFPITFKSFVSMRKMQALQPMIKELQAKYKNDAQKLNAEMMKLYRENGVNPMAGCLPMFLQIPVFFALFAVLRTNVALRGEPFILWIKDLSVKDPYYILPILTGIAMFISQKISNTDPKQQTMVYIMPLMMVFLFMNFPSGVLVYWLTYNIISIFQQYMVSRHPHVRGLDNTK